MQLIGMLDSPYVRRVAISLDTLSIAFDHLAVSVFSHFEKFQELNPVVKAPTLICDDGKFIMDSSIILQFIDMEYADAGSLWNKSRCQQELRIVSLALAACDKSVQVVYEKNLRPKEYRYEPWLERVMSQIFAALSTLELELQTEPDIFSDNLNQATITTVVMWSFIQTMLANEVSASKYPSLNEFAAKIEKLEQFKKYPISGPGVKG